MLVLRQYVKRQATSKTIEATYQKEYGVDILTLHEDAIKPGQRVLICDDLLATGGTIKATIELVEKLGGIVVGCAFLIELMDLQGRDKITGYEIKTLMEYYRKSQINFDLAFCLFGSNTEIIDLLFVMIKIMVVVISLVSLSFCLAEFLFIP